MPRFKNLLVCLDLSPKDKDLLAHASILAKTLEAENLVFLHSLSHNREPAPHSPQRSSDEALSLLSNGVSKWFEGNPSLNTEYYVCEGPPLNEIVEYAAASKIDVILCGKGSKDDAHNLLPHRLARRAPCSVFIIPNGSETHFKRILVAIDQSERSSEALRAAASISENSANAKLILVEAIDMPHGSQMSLGANRFVDLKERCRQQIERFAQQSGIGDAPFETAVASNIKASVAILEIARKRDADLIVMGSKGKGAVAATLLGSNVENVAKVSPIPLLIVKPNKSAH